MNHNKKYLFELLIFEKNVCFIHIQTSKGLLLNYTISRCNKLLKKKTDKCNSMINYTHIGFTVYICYITTKITFL